MKYLKKHPMIVLVIGILGISLSAILVRYSTAPAAVTAAFRLLWTVLIMTPIVLGKESKRKELKSINRKMLLLSCLSGFFLAIHFTVWFESLRHTSVASSTTIVCTEVIWVALGFWLFMKGKISKKAIATIAFILIGSVLIAYADSVVEGAHLYGDILALLAAFAAAVYMLIGRTVQKNVSTTIYTYVAYGTCAVTLLAICLIQGHNILDYGIENAFIGLMLGIFSTLLGHSIFSWCLKFYSPSFVSAAKLCEPVVAAMLAVVLFEEMPTILQLIGSIMILGGVYYYSRIENQK